MVGNGPSPAYIARDELERVLLDVHGWDRPDEYDLKRRRFRARVDDLLGAVRVRMQAAGAAPASGTLLDDREIQSVLAGCPPLTELPWSQAWLRDLIGQAALFESGSLRHARTIATGVSDGGWVVKVSLKGLRELGLEPIEVDWTPSRESQRKRLRRAADAQLLRQYEAERHASDGRISYRRWVDRSPFANAVFQLIEQKLEETHPAGGRPFTLDARRQIRCDVFAWVETQIEGKTARALTDPATWPADLRLPRTQQGIGVAQRRADSLLRKAR